MAFKIPFIDVKSFTKGYFQDIPNFRWADVTEKEEIGKGSFGSVMKANYEVFWRGRIKFKGNSERGKDVTRSTTSQSGRVCCRLPKTGRYYDGV